MSSKIYIKILNEENSTVQEIDEFEFHVGEERTLKLQLWHEGNSSAYILDVGATVVLKLTKKTGFLLEKDLVIDGANRSVVSATLTELESIDLITSDIIVEINESTVTRIAKNLRGRSGMVLLK